MSVHAHPDRWARLPPAVEELARVEQRDIHELVRVVEIDRLDVERARWRHDDQLSVVAVSFDVVDQATVGEQADGVQCHRERAAGRLGEGAGVAGG
jgi:hypothetical protein